MMRTAPGPTGCERLRLLRLYVESGDQIAETLTAPVQRRLRDEYGPVVRLRVPFGSNLYFLTAPDYVRQVFDAEPAFVRKSDCRMDDLAVMFGPGTVTSEGNRWQERRSAMAPALGRNLVRSVAPAANAIAGAQLEAWSRESSPVETTEMASRYVFETVGTALFGEAFAEGDAELASAMATFGEVFPREASMVPDIPRRIPTPHNRRIQRAQERLETAVGDILRAVSSTEDADCVAAALLTADGLDRASLREELRGVFVAGLVASKALSCAIYRIADHETVQATARERVRAVDDTPPHTAPPGYLRNVIHEVLRLHPPLPPDVRTPTEPLRVGDYVVPTGAKLVVNQLPIHHHPRVWEDPLAFRPARFDAAGPSERHPYGFFPFGRGPRQCPGREVAYMALGEFLARLLNEYVVRPVSSEPTVGPNPTDPEPVAIGLRPIDSDADTV